MDELSDSVLAHLREAVDLPDLSQTRYEWIGQLGRGGMGTVHLVRDTQLDREVALKVVESHSAAEAHTTARLEHPGIVPVHDSGTLPDGRLYFAMKRIEGIRLDQYRDTGPAHAELLRVFLRACEPVAYAHAHGVIHCDLKPQNIMTGKFGEVLVLDWGAAKNLDPAGPIAGTPDFIAPEQQAGNPTPLSDIFSLGRTLEALCGPGVRRALMAIAQKAAATNPADRYPSVEALMQDLRRYMDGEPVQAYPEPLLEKAARILTRNQTLVLLIVSYIALRVLLFLFIRR